MHKKNIGRVCSQRHALVKKQKVGEREKGKDKLSSVASWEEKHQGELR